MKKLVPCSCFAPVPFEYDEEIDLKKTPEVANRIFEGTFMSVKCPKCGKELHPEFNFTIKHEDKKIDILFVPERERDDYLRGKSRYQFKKVSRIVIGFPELQEKLKIVNEGLDDLVVETVKYYMLSKIEADNKPENEVRCYFDHLDEKSNLVFQIHGLKQDEVGFLAIPKSFYDVARVKMLAYKRMEPFSLFLTPPYVSVLRISRVYEDIQEEGTDGQADKPADSTDEK